LLGLVALYFVGFGPFSQQIAINAAKNKACGNYTGGTPPCVKTLSDMPVDFDVNNDGMFTITDDNFKEFAIKLLNCPDDLATPVDETIQCVRQLCACPGY